MEKDGSLIVDKTLKMPMEAIEFIEFHLVHQLEELLSKTTHTGKFIGLHHRFEKIRTELESINLNPFLRLQEIIREKGYRAKAFKDLINAYVHIDRDYGQIQEEIGYDTLDILINALCSLQYMPKQTKELGPDMVYYQKTPAKSRYKIGCFLQMKKIRGCIDLDFTVATKPSR
jgi:hypothetical protein